MAYISKDTIQSIRDNVRISEVFSWLGAKVVAKGSKSMAFCPFCEDSKSRNPGCSLNDTEGLFHCFVCGASGDMFKAVMDAENCNFPESIEMIAKQFNIPVKYEASKNPEADSRRRQMVEALESANEMFKEQRANRQFSDFLMSRNMPYGTAEEYELGLSSYTEADNVVRRLRDKGISDDVLVNSGLCFKDDGGNAVLRFRNRIMYPIRTAPGTLIGFGGRDITGNSNAKYINSPETEMFKKRDILYGINIAKRHLQKENRVFVCEGYMDTIALQTHGFPNTVGVMGTALTEKNFMYLSRFVKDIYIALDADAAGQNAAMRVANEIPINFAGNVSVITIPLEISKDPDEFFNQRGRTSLDWEKLTENATPIFLFCVKRLIQEEVDEMERLFLEGGEDAANVSKLKNDAKQKTIRFVSEHLRRINTDEQRAIADYLATSMRLVESYSQLAQQWSRAAGAKGKRDASQKMIENFGSFSSSSTRNEDMLIGSVYYHPESRNEIKKNLAQVKTVFTSKVRESIFDKICECQSSGRRSETVKDMLDTQETAELARILLEDCVQENKDKLGVAVVENICKAIKKHSIEREIKQIEESPMPDLLKIVMLKSELANLL